MSENQKSAGGAPATGGAHSTYIKPMDDFEILFSSESTEEEHLKQMVGEGHSVVDEHRGDGEEEQGETATLPGAIKAMDDIKIDENASLVERRHIGNTLERVLRFGRKKESNNESDARKRKTNSATTSRGNTSGFVGNSTRDHDRDHDDDDDNNTVDEMIEASEREEETNLKNILERIPASSDSVLVATDRNHPLSAAVSTKDIRRNISKSLHDREVSRTNHTSSMNNLLSTKRRLWDDDDSLGNETIGKIVTHMMDNSTKTGGEDERTLRSGTDFQSIVGSVATPMSKISITTDNSNGNSNNSNANVTNSNSNNKFVDDETSVGSISEEIEVIVAKHNRQLNEEVGAINNIEKGDAVTIANSNTMISSLSFDTTYYASRARSLLGAYRPPATDEIADTTPPTFKIVGEVTDEENGGDNDGKDDGDGDDAESRESETWWVRAEKTPSTPMRLSDETPSPQNSVGKSNEAPGTPSTVILPGHLLGLATPTPSDMDSYEYEDDQYTRKSNGANVGRKKITTRGHLTFYKHLSNKYGSFYVWLILGAAVMLLLAAIFVIAAFATLGQSDKESNEPPRPPPLILPPEESSNIFGLDSITINVPPSEISHPSDWTSVEEGDGSTQIDPATVSPDQSVIEDTDPATISPDQPVIEDTEDLIDPGPVVDLDGSIEENVEDFSDPAVDQPQTSEIDETLASFDERLRQTISQRLPESLSKLEDPTSPQFRALEWLKSNSPTVDELKVKPIAQRYVLAVLYFSTNGEEWLDNTGWLSSDEECEWFSTSTSSKNNVCDRSGRVTEINLRSNNLNGILPSELVLLAENLTRIQVNGNTLSGTFPSFVGEMTNLVRFHAHWNLLSGTVPTNLGELSSSLLSLRVGHNDFVGTIPRQLGDLESLEALDLSSNELTGTIPSFLGDLSNLSTYTVLLLRKLSTSFLIASNKYAKANNLVSSNG